MASHNDHKLIHFLGKLSAQKFSMLVAAAIFTVILVITLPLSLIGIDQVSLGSESLDTKKVVGRVVGILDNEITRLAQLNLDWSGWDETYQFARGENPQYIEKNLNQESIVNIGVNLIVVTDLNGQAKAVISFDQETQKVGPPPFALSDLFQKYPDLLENREVTSQHRGYAIVGDQAMLISSLPILTSLYEGPSAGSLIFAIYLDQAEIAEINHLSQRDIKFWLPSQTGLPGIGDAKNIIDSETGITLHPLNAQEIAAYQVVKDLNGQPGLVLQINNPRDLFAQGKSIALLFSIVSVLICLAASGLIYRIVYLYRLSRAHSRQVLERFEAIFSQSRNGILLIDSLGTILEANPVSLELLKLRKEEVQIVRLDDVLTNDRDPEQSVLDLIKVNGLQRAEYACHLKDGTYKYLEMSASNINSLDLQAYSINIIDVTSREEAQEALKASEERYQLATRGANDGLWDWNLLTDTIYYSARWKSMLGYGVEEISCSITDWLDRVHPDDRLQLKSKLDDHLNNHTEHFESEYRILNKGGDYRWMLSRGVAVWNEAGFAQRMAGSQTDITRQKIVEEQLRYDALHDGLTGLGNRTLLVDRLIRVNQRKLRRPEMLFALLFLDLDRFKGVNDSFGHQVGDKILVETSRRLENNLRAVDTVSRFIDETLTRIAGDEFVILLEDIRDFQDAETIASRILNVMNEPFSIGGITITIGISIGIVIPEASYKMPEDIIRDADIAMYKSKLKGGSTQVLFSEDMYESAVARIQLENDLRKAVKSKEFILHYQPIFSIQNDTIAGFEALVRWKHPHLGLLMPKDFIEVAEETGLIVPIGFEVLREACGQMKKWQRHLGLSDDIIMSVNLSTRQLTVPNLVDQVKTVLQECGLNSKNLWLEITETTLIENLDVVQHVLVGLRELGIHIEIDDFGVGYSSFSYLRNLPIDGFKIDRSFINDISGSGKQIVKTLVELGKDLKLTAVAEGVETTLQKEYLEGLDCRFLQGYLKARPMSAEMIEKFVGEQVIHEII